MAKKNRTDPDSASVNGNRPVIRKPKKKDKEVPLTDAQKFIHGIRLHQIELEIQNEELKIAQHEAASLLEKYSLRFDHAPISYFTLSTEGIICDLNISAAALFERERSSMINQAFESLLSPDSILVFKKFLEEVFGGNSNSVCEVTLSGNEEISSSLLLKATFSAKEQMYYLVASEITDRRIAEDALAEQKELYHTIFRKNPAITFLLDPETEEILDANPVAAGFYGYSQENLGKMKFSDLSIHSQEELSSILKNVIPGEKKHVSFRQKLSGGIIREVEASFDPIQINGRSYILSVLEDITDKRRAEEVKKEQKFWTEESYKSIGTGTFRLDFTKDCWIASDLLEEILGIEAKTDRTINGFLSLVHPDQKAGFQYYLFSEVIARKQPFNREFCIIRPNDGRERFVRGNAELEFNDSGMLMSLEWYDTGYHGKEAF